MNPTSPTVFIVFLRFGPNRAQAGQWMAGHKQWIQDGMADGSFLMAGSLENAQGGLVIATGTDAAAIQARVAQDPFVLHGVVTVDIHAVAPSVMKQGLSELLASSGGVA